MSGREETAARRIIANLDAEVGLAREEAAARAGRGEAAPSPRDPRFALPLAVERSISALGTLLRAFARDGDRLWAPRAVDAARMAPVEGLRAPVLESGPMERLPRASATLVWARTEAVEPFPGARGGPGPLHEAVWSLPACPAEAARRANHRLLALEMALDLGHALRGARAVNSIEDIEVHLRAGGAAEAPAEGWVLKAPHAAAGRSRLRGRGRELDLPARRRAQALLELQGVLVFEPWMERTADFAALGLIDGGGPRLIGAHRLLMSSGGAFQGIEIAPGGAKIGPTAADAALLESTAMETGRRLHAIGYRGPFGIDAWRWRDLRGEERFHPLGEINARLTLGHVARAIRERAAVGARPEETFRLRVQAGRAQAESLPPPARRIDLLRPAPDESTAAWIEVG